MKEIWISRDMNINWSNELYKYYHAIQINKYYHTILSGELKMSAKRATMGRFTPKYPKLDQQVIEWFSQQREQGWYLLFCLKF